MRPVTKKASNKSEGAGLMKEIMGHLKIFEVSDIQEKWGGYKICFKQGWSGIFYKSDVWKLVPFLKTCHIKCWASVPDDRLPGSINLLKTIKERI